MSNQKFFNFSSPSFKQKAILLFLWAAIVVAIIMVRSVILPFLLAGLLAYVFHPLVVLLGKIKFGPQRLMPRVVSVLLIYLFFIGLILLFCAFFVPRFYFEMVRLVKEATGFINDIDENSVAEFGNRLEDFFRAYQIPLEIVGQHGKAPMPPSGSRPNWISIDLFKISNFLLNDILLYVKSETKNIIASAQYIFSQFISGMFMVMLVFMLTGFLLVDVKHIKEFLFQLVPSNDRASFDSFLTRLDARLSGVVRGQLIICLVNAILTLIGLLIFKVKYAFILATIAGIFSMVPVFGSIISTIPIVLVAVTVSPLTGLFSLLWVIGIHIVEANLLNPKIMGGAAEIHPVLIVLALVVGEHFYGIVGALLAVPLMSIVITLFMFILGKAQQLDEGVHKPNES